jgi:hypothetical protein
LFYAIGVVSGKIESKVRFCVLYVFSRLFELCISCFADGDFIFFAGAKKTEAKESTYTFAFLELSPNFRTQFVTRFAQTRQIEHKNLRTHSRQK